MVQENFVTERTKSDWFDNSGAGFKTCQLYTCTGRITGETVVQDFSSAWLCCPTVPSNEAEVPSPELWGKSLWTAANLLAPVSKQAAWFGSCKCKVKGWRNSQSKQTKKIVAKKTLNHKSFSRTPLEVAAYCFWCATPLPKLMILQVCPFRSYHLHPPILSGLEEWSSTKIPPSYYSGLQTASQHPFTKAAAKLRSLPH